MERDVERRADRESTPSPSAPQERERETCVLITESGRAFGILLRGLQNLLIKCSVFAARHKTNKAFLPWLSGVRRPEELVRWVETCPRPQPHHIDRSSPHSRGDFTRLRVEFCCYMERGTAI